VMLGDLVASGRPQGGFAIPPLLCPRRRETLIVAWRDSPRLPPLSPRPCRPATQWRSAYPPPGYRGDEECAMQFVADGPDIPDSLLEAHGEGRVVFFCGAGISYPAGLPGFEGLVKEIYRRVGTPTS
jgi:hypothetical protein